MQHSMLGNLFTCFTPNKALFSVPNIALFGVLSIASSFDEAYA